MYDKTRGVALLFGGDNGLEHGFGNYISVFEAATNTWTGLPAVGKQPKARDDACVAYDTRTGQVYEFGGSGEESNYLNDLWSYNPISNTWTECKTSGRVPSPRQEAAMIYDSKDDRLYLFGGAGGPADVHLADLWCYDLKAGTWNQLPYDGNSPGARSNQAMIYSPVGDQIIMFGGSGDSAYYDDTWTYDIRAATWSKVATKEASPPARGFAAATYDSKTNELMMFGGCNTTSELNDLWAYAIGTGRWQQLTPRGTRPSARDNASMAYDPETDTTLLAGGDVQPYGGDPTILPSELWVFKR